ncbi:MAG: hypothetical protein PHW69_05540 [Elusimicrobiaceae bacterium]|nr:hypothetical protein [Elusimicrobiaceae bacterium]
MRKILLTVLSGALLGAAAPAAQAFWPFGSKEKIAEPAADGKERVAAPELESQSCADKFDNVVSSAIPPVNYDALVDSLAEDLGLTENQEQKLRELFEKHRQKYEARLKDYAEQSELLSKKRESLVVIRDKIQETIDRIPSVLMTRLEEDQKRDYLVILEKQIAAEGRKIKKVVPPPPAAVPAAETTVADEKPAAAPEPEKKVKKKAEKKEEKPKLAPEFEGFNLPI